MSTKNLIKKVNKFEREYTAEVVSNNDPLLRGRIQVKVDSILGETPFWVSSTLTGGSVRLVLVPEPKDKVIVKFRNKDVYSGVWELKGNPDDNAQIDPKKYGLQDDQGNFIIIDRATNDISINSTNNFNVIATGNCNIKVSGSAVINVAGNTDLTTPTCNIHADAVNLGDGGPPIARVGDSVEVIDKDAQHGGTWKGTITSGGTNTSI